MAIEDFGDFGSAGEELQWGAPTATGATSGAATSWEPGVTPTPSPGVGSKLLSFAGDVGEGIGREFTGSPLKAFSSALGLGSAGFNIANQMRLGGQLNEQSQQIRRQQKTAEAAAAPAVSFGQEQLTAAGQGKLPGPQQAAIEQWKQKAKADMRARLASMGLGNSTAITSEDSKIDLMAEAMIGQLLQGQEQVGLQGLQTGVQAASGGAQTSQNQQAMLAQLIQGADKQLAQLGATQA